MDDDCYQSFEFVFLCKHVIQEKKSVVGLFFIVELKCFQEVDLKQENWRLPFSRY